LEQNSVPSKKLASLFTLELSVLSPLSLCTDYRLIVTGVHGVFISLWGHQAVFLPQVPVEQGWDLETYLDQLCFKAGLDSGAYRRPEALLSVFTSEHREWPLEPPDVSFPQ
jgi:AMMECR1 domain-containing protein